MDDFEDLVCGACGIIDEEIEMIPSSASNAEHFVLCPDCAASNA